MMFLTRRSRTNLKGLSSKRMNRFIPSSAYMYVLLLGLSLLVVQTMAITFKSSNKEWKRLQKTFPEAKRHYLGVYWKYAEQVGHANRVNYKKRKARKQEYRTMDKFIQALLDRDTAEADQEQKRQAEKKEHKKWLQDNAYDNIWDRYLSHRNRREKAANKPTIKLKEFKRRMVRKKNETNRNRTSSKYRLSPFKNMGKFLKAHDQMQELYPKVMRNFEKFNAYKRQNYEEYKAVVTKWAKCCVAPHRYSRYGDLLFPDTNECQRNFSQKLGRKVRN